VTDPACFSSRPFVRLQSWRRLAVFVPILVAKETVGQLETVSEGFPNCTGKVFAGARLRAASAARQSIRALLDCRRV
jgi:hypothetical protein